MTEKASGSPGWAWRRRAALDTDCEPGSGSRAARLRGHGLRSHSPRGLPSVRSTCQFPVTLVADSAAPSRRAVVRPQTAHPSPLWASSVHQLLLRLENIWPTLGSPSFLLHTVDSIYLRVRPDSRDRLWSRPVTPQVRGAARLPGCLRFCTTPEASSVCVLYMCACKRV